MKKQNGITLIALVITIVVLIILAGVAISLTLSENGLFNRSREAVNQYKQAEANETNALDGVVDYINKVTSTNTAE